MFKRVFLRIFILCLVFYLPATPNDWDASQRLSSAKKVCLEGRTRNAKDTERLASELEKWGRYQLAERPFCDITIGIQAASGNQISNAGKLRLNDDRDYLVFTVWDYQAGAMIYRDIVEWSFSGNPIRTAVKNMRLRVEPRQHTRSSGNQTSHP